MNETTHSASDIGIRIGAAMARDVIADSLPREWTGLDPQDADQIPEGVDRDAVEAAAEAEYRRIVHGK